MADYCPNCGAKLADGPGEVRTCAECGENPDPAIMIHRVISYGSSVLLVLFALTAIAPVEGYENWYLTAAVHSVTAVVTLPVVKRYLRDHTELNVTRAASITTVFLGFVIGLYLIPPGA